jgi:single-stranded-DNA-specific exonuclease
MEKRWLVKTQADYKTVDKLSEELSINKVLANMLVRKDINTFDKAKSFFRPSLNDLHDPFLMKGMNIAVNRLNKAIKENEKILIYGDYDVDGTTSVALVYSYIRKYYNNLNYYVPDRYEEGYGISYKGIDYANENGFSLVIALDCGIKAVEKIDYANERNVDFIICDHHLPDEKIPNAVAVLDAKQKDCNYPFKELSGCGVGFKFMQAFSVVNGFKATDVYEYLDLVAISIASDIVPIIGENRVLAFYGLRTIETSPSPSVKALKEVSGIKKNNITISDIVFKIGPRINAAGRIESANKSVELLISRNYIDAIEFAKRIDEINTERKEIDHNITEQALDTIIDSVELQGKKTTVLYNPEWSKGVIGIVASRLTENYFRPTVILTESAPGIASGSARSVPGFNLYDAISHCSHLLDSFGGHMYAAGLTLKIENIEEFTSCFEEFVNNTITESQLIPQINVDSVICFKDVDQKFFNILSQFAPFGPGNMHPVFVARDVVDTGKSKVVGKDSTHLKVSFEQDGVVFNGIAFGMSDKYELLKDKKPVDICFTLEENEFMGNVTLQLSIIDIKAE